MTEKHTTPETSFDVGEIYSRLDQAIYEHREEEEEKYGRKISDEKTKTYETAINVIVAIGRMNPRPNSKEDFIKTLDGMKKEHGIDDFAYRAIMEHVY